ncbi:MAG: hypothetical protein AAFY41_06550, partial [Bacteroidota bacterium]
MKRIALIFSIMIGICVSVISQQTTLSGYKTIYLKDGRVFFIPYQDSRANVVSTKDAQNPESDFFIPQVLDGSEINSITIFANKVTFEKGKEDLNGLSRSLADSIRKANNWGSTLPLQIGIGHYKEFVDQ